MIDFATLFDEEHVRFLENLEESFLWEQNSDFEPDDFDEDDQEDIEEPDGLWEDEEY